MFELSSAISGATATLKGLKLAVEARDEKKIDEAISDLKDRLFDAQTANVHVVEKLHESQAERHALVKELDELKASVIERSLYILDDLGQGGISFLAYRYDRESGLALGRKDAAHYLCQPCFDNNRKSALIHNGTGSWSCSCCGATAQVRDNPAVTSFARSRGHNPYG